MWLFTDWWPPTITVGGSVHRTTTAHIDILNAAIHSTTTAHISVLLAASIINRRYVATVSILVPVLFREVVLTSNSKANSAGKKSQERGELHSYSVIPFG